MDYIIHVLGTHKLIAKRPLQNRNVTSVAKQSLRFFNISNGQNHDDAGINAIVSREQSPHDLRAYETR